MGQPKYARGFEVALHPQELDRPKTWRKPRLVFVNSMSDLFHGRVPVAFLERVFEVMADTPRHTYQVLTKRPERAAFLADRLPWPPNVWLGASVESNDYLWRAEQLRAIPARIRFLSLEPLLAPVPDLDLAGLDWVIVGGESGPGARPLEPDWARAVRDRCGEANVPFFFKQWGGVHKHRTGRTLDGRTWDGFPDMAQPG